MIASISGTLLSQDAIVHVLPDAFRGLLDEAGRDSARERLRAWHLPLRRELGPATSARGCFDRVAAPLLSRMGYRVLPSGRGPGGLHALLQSGGAITALTLVTAWGHDPSAVWRECVHHGIAHGVRWCLCITGPLLRVIDSQRTYSRRYVEFDIQTVCDDPSAFAPFWGLLRAEAMSAAAGGSTLLDRAIALSEEHRTSVRDALQDGVREALLHFVMAFRTAAQRRHRRRSERTAPVLEQSLVIIYRVLFLLFAEARGMVPHWHPIYRGSYTIEALRDPIEHLPRPPGLWESLQAIARLAHRGCHVGTLRVTAFNGRLFSPVHAPLAESEHLDDGPVRTAMLALTTRETKGGRQRIAYGDLGVEHLGGVYERLLDFDLEVLERGTRFVRSEQRKATGSFYTPRSLTEYLVRRTLAPLVRDAAPERILALRIVDPAMGSGAFLVAACRYLAAAYEAALIREGAASSGEIDERERAGFRRLIAQRCLYGVDNNPMAVQLARLSLWLATLAADRPLTFLDHRLRAGNSLLGASLADIARQPPSGGRARRGTRPLPLFPDDDFQEAVRQAVEVRTAIAVEPGDTLAQVRQKERALAGLADPVVGIARWKMVADLWCAGWFGPAAERRQRASAFPDLIGTIRTGTSALPTRLTQRLLAGAQAVAARMQFFHWTLEFPEVFITSAGDSPHRRGFDAVLGNPPWEMLRGDRGSDDLRSSSRTAATELIDFARGSGVYRLPGDGHPNLYQLFLERALALLGRGGRLGLLLPAGFATDRGSARLRRTILEGTHVDSCVSIENRDGIFPIHRGVKFIALTLSNAGRTTALPCRFGLRHVEALDSLPDTEPDPAAVRLPRALLNRVGGEDLAIPDVRNRMDLEILSHAAFSFPALADDEWSARFGRELNASDDRQHFLQPGRGLPVLEGKQVTPFRADVAATRFSIAPATAARLLDVPRTFARARLAYRDVAASTNQRTLIAAIVPAGVVTTHTLFCLKGPADEPTQHYLCGIFNSFVANYLVRLRVNTHVSAGIIERLPVPRPLSADARLQEVATIAVKLANAPDPAASARLQAIAAGLYRLSRAQFQHVLSTFPLVPQPERDAAFRAFAI